MVKIILAVLLMTSMRVSAAENDNYNFRWSPLTLLFRSTAFDLDRKVSEHCDFGASMFYSDQPISAKQAGTNNDVSRTTLGFGLHSHWYKNGAFKSGLYAGPSLSYSSIRDSMADSHGDARYGSGDLFRASAALGYGWFWDTWNIMLQASAGLPIGKNYVVIKDPNGTESHISGGGLFGVNFTVGWTF